jgi:2-polyprenyl-6-methoxyphenol hydroxylase-like FAD-dependent oxidoreductase/3-oxoacyl-[acyl-carrier-protein] synthase III
VRLAQPLGLASVTAWVPETTETAAGAVSAGRLTSSEVQTTGYRRLPVSSGLAAPEMAVLAARRGLARAGRAAAELRVVAHAWTYHQGHDFWSPAHYIASQLGADRAVPFGIQQMCNGGGIALQLAATQLAAEPEEASALVTTADRFCAPGFDRWHGDYGLWYGDGATAAVLSSRTGPDDDLELLAIHTVAAPDIETMHRGEDGFSAAPHQHGEAVDIRRTKKAFLQAHGKEHFSAVVAEKVPAVVRAALAEAGLRASDERVRCVLLPRLGRTPLQDAYEPALAAVTPAPALDLGEDTGHLGAGDLLANLAALVERELLAPGEIALALSAGGGFTWSCAVVRRPAAERHRSFHRRQKAGRPMYSEETTSPPQADRSRDPVLVVGAGPVGMVMACALLSHDIPVRIIDSAPRSTVHSRAVIVWPRSLELMRGIGVSEELSALGEHLDAVSYYSGARRLGAIEMSRLADTPYPFGLCTPQDRTEDVIRRRLVELGGTVESEVALTGLDNTGPRPLATLTHPGGRTEQLSPRWLIGADGSRSTTRELLGIPFEGTGSDVLFAICDAPMEADLPPHEMLYCYNRGGAMGIAPFGDGAFRVACAVPVWNDDEAPPRELFQDNLDRVVPFDAQLGELRWTTVFRARRRTAASFRDGRCFLVGDSAHIFSAAGSQGMNTGIQDALNLAWKLVGLERGTVEANVLDTYDPERRFSAERVSQTTAKQTTWGLVKQPQKVAVRDALVRAAQVSGALQHLVTPLMSQLSVDYGSERDDAKADLRWRKRSLRPGQRLPVFLAEEGCAEHSAWQSVAADRFGVLLWAGGRRDVAWDARCAALRAALSPAIPVDDASERATLAPFLGSGAVAIVIRPDGHVAAIEQDASPDHMRRVLEDVGAVMAATAEPAPAEIRVLEASVRS